MLHCEKGIYKSDMRGKGKGKGGERGLKEILDNLRNVLIEYEKKKMRAEKEISDALFHKE